jgi:hypothetical protein
MRTKSSPAALALAFALALTGCKTTGGLAMSAPTAVEIVQAQLDAYNARDLDAFAATYAEGIVITNAKCEVLVTGLEALRKRYGGIFEKFPLNHARIAARKLEGGEVVLDHEIITGRAPDKPDPWDVGWVRYEVESGRIARVVLP